MSSLKRQPLARRIVIGFTLLTAVISGLFSFGIVAVVHFVEEHLVSKELGRQMTAILHTDLPAGRAPRLDPSTQFYMMGNSDYPVPARLRDVGTGFTERSDDDDAVYIYMREVNGVRYYLEQDQREFEAREHALYRVVFAGFVLSVGIAWLLGQMTARGIMRPVSRLAQQVLHRDQLSVSAPPLAPDYPNDEIGYLAQAFDHTLYELRHSLERERLFTADVSHELRTPLMVITGATELLAEADLSPQERMQLLRVIRASDDMAGLVETFLRLARRESGAVPCGGTLSLRACAEAQAAFWAPLFHEKGLSFELDAGADLPCQYDAVLLRAVISNLLRNALHYTDQGGVVLHYDGNRFSVEDTGIGIPAHLRQRIFEPFKRLEHAQARGEGLGLGLSLVRRICLREGWQIEVSDRSPSGSCFVVTLGAGCAPV
ncbi:sensor histidine kinase [Isoalcanivorax beigongshangi]|uniref:histidine kinase n=1 Tax=Isoalcanivorax beigongshangi TaxID=3238810 RepID=A0ABV4AHK3_9GAMM